MADLSPAGELRKAAQLIREHAQAATQGPWRVDATAEGDPVIYVPHPNIAEAANVLFEADWGTEEDAYHIASMHPGVAAAVAAWLERTAADEEFGEVTGLDEALAVARAYLGGTDDPDR